jgi:putative transposase
MRPAPQEIRTYFITTITASRRRLFQVEQTALLLIDVLQDQRSKKHIELHAFVVMPDHLHLVLTPSPETSLEKAIQYIKGGFSFRLHSKADVWQRSYDNRRIVDSNDFAERVHYIHHNPVRARIVSQPGLYRFSSANESHPTDPAPLHLKPRG